MSLAFSKLSIYIKEAPSFKAWGLVEVAGDQVFGRITVSIT